MPRRSRPVSLALVCPKEKRKKEKKENDIKNSQLFVID
jgi:hypothetical protein